MDKKILIKQINEEIVILEELKQDMINKDGVIALFSLIIEKIKMLKQNSEGK